MKCKVPDCEKYSKNSKHGLCGMHEMRVRRWGSTDPRERIVKQYCEVEGCGRPHQSRGLCSSHAWRRSQGRSLIEPPLPPRLFDYHPCIVPNCKRIAAASHGFCVGHYTHWTKTGNAPVNPKPPRPRGRWINPSDGYAFVMVEGRQRKEHRVVMEQILGRPLTEDEDVHHVNGVRSDNRPENLELWSFSHPRGQRIPDKIAWCLEFLSRYGEVSFRQQEAKLFKADIADTEEAIEEMVM